MLKKACSVPVVDKEFRLSERKKHPAHSILLHVRNYLYRSGVTVSNIWLLLQKLDNCILHQYFMI